MSAPTSNLQAIVEGVLSRRAPTRFRSRPAGVDGPCCPKCSFTGADAPPLMILDGWRQVMHVDTDAASLHHACDEQGRPLVEFLLVKCPRCQYGWAEPIRGEAEAAPS